jgi:hypothetical protein
MVGRSKLKAARLLTVLLPLQLTVGGVVSTMVTVWLQALLRLQQLVTTQVRVMFHGQEPLVTVLRIVTVTLVPQQASEAVGESNDQAKPHWTVLLPAQVRTGGVVSTTVTVWLQALLRLQQLVTTQVRVMFHGQEPLVTVLRIVTVTLVPQQVSEAVGESNDQTEPHWIVLLVAQVRTGGLVSTTVTVWLHVAVLLQQSVAFQVRVMSHGQ